MQILNNRTEMYSLLMYVTQSQQNIHGTKELKCCTNGIRKLYNLKVSKNIIPPICCTGCPKKPQNY